MDIFDRIAPDKEDVFDRVTTEETALDSVKKQLSSVLDRFDQEQRKVKKQTNDKLSSELKTFIQGEISKIKPVQNVIEKTLEKETVRNIQVPVQLPPPPKTIDRTVDLKVEFNRRLNDLETRLTKKEPKPSKAYAEQSALDALQKEIEQLKQDKEGMKQALLFSQIGGSGVIGIPAPEGNESKVLTVKNGKASWQTAAGSVSPDAYTVTGLATNRSLSSTSTIDQLYQVLGSLITSLQGAGIVQ